MGQRTDYTIARLAAVVGHHPEALRRLARTGRLHGAYKLGREWRIAPEAVAKLRGMEAGLSRDGGEQK